jgi:hypothetical protein
MAAVAATLNRSMKFEQLRAEVENSCAPRWSCFRQVTSMTKGAQQVSRRRATDADGCKDLGKQKERRW